MPTKRQDTRNSPRLTFVGRYLALVLLPVMLLRSGSELFHSHEAAQGVSISAPCNACELEATFAIEGIDPAPLPTLPVLQRFECLANESHPFVPFTLRSSGRAPPQA
ncbi:MAG: hypothetical protein Q8902_02945 [Bacteroidota bacterium]|nr:hypothetical protein [Bacteroidota bacterium]MDP4232564.1 hypothetical protein [Bacteroidota bacterium]